MGTGHRVEDVVSGPVSGGWRPPMCDRCSSPPTVLLVVDTVDPNDPGPFHARHVTTAHVCAEHVPAGLGVVLDAVNNRPGRPPATVPPAAANRTAADHTAELAATFRLAAAMLDAVADGATPWPAVEVAAVRDRLRRLAEHAPR